MDSNGGAPAAIESGRGERRGLSSSPEAEVIAVLGATGSGKSSYVKERTAATARVLIWDPLQEYRNGVTCWELADLVRQISLHQGGAFRIIFRPSASRAHRVQQFDAWCKTARTVGNLTMVVEELRLVTTPQMAPDQWSECTLTGRHSGLVVIGTSQRPASVDKDFLGNCTLVHTGNLVYHRDRENVARSMGVTEGEIANLPPMGYLEWDRKTRQTKTGTQKYIL